MFRWAAIWLGIGFALKWWNERKGTFYAKIKEWSEKMFNLILVVASFALVWIVFGVLALTGIKALMVFVFWWLVLIVLKAK
jgi:Na+/serine symporter